MSEPCPDKLPFHLVSFEGPDPYSRAGGLASRMDGLSRALTGLGFETHLWFVGDPDQPAAQRTADVLHLHRWCQWLSRLHPGGVYDGQEPKIRDLAASLPPVLVDQVLAPALGSEGEAVILAEEWQTAETVLGIDRRLREAGLRDRVALLWNANNVFGFERIDWQALAKASAVTTVSRMMRQRMEPLGLRPLVIPNGLPPEAFDPPDRARVARLRARLRGRLALAKVARWDPEKAWLAAIAGVRALADAGRRPLLLARGGGNGHETEVREAAKSAGLRWLDRPARTAADPVLEALEGSEEADVVCLGFPLDSPKLRVLYRAVDAVLANSRFEPFGLVGLETMAAGGVACLGVTGEDYALPGRNALVLQTEDPQELVAVLARLEAHPKEERSLRHTARRTARTFAWQEVVTRILLPRVELLHAPSRRR